MNPWAPLVGTLGYNYLRHRRGLPTICSTARRHVPRKVAVAGLSLGFAWLLPHVVRGYPIATPEEQP